MPGTLKEILRGSILHDASDVHHHDSIAEMSYQPQVVRDEQIRQSQLILYVQSQVHDLSLNRHVQRGCGFVSHDEGRVQGHGASNAYPLTLPA